MRLESVIRSSCMTVVWSIMLGLFAAMSLMATPVPPLTYPEVHEQLAGRWEMQSEGLLFWYEYDHGRYRTGSTTSDRVTRSSYTIIEVEDDSIWMELESDWYATTTRQRVHLSDDGQSYTMNGLIFERVE